VLYRFAADLVLVIHLAFVLAVVVGALAWLWWHRAPWVHLPVAAWGAYVELSGRLCPLTTLENALLRAAGEGGYDGSFIGQYLLAVLYPAGLTREVQLVLAAGVVGINVILYAWIWHRRRRRAGGASRR
jgi:hypothetical protein